MCGWSLPFSYSQEYHFTFSTHSFLSVFPPIFATAPFFFKPPLFACLSWQLRLPCLLGPPMHPGPSLAIRVTAQFCLIPSAKSCTSLGFQAIKQGLEQALEIAAFEALCRNQSVTEKKEVWPPSASHPVGIRPEHALALRRIELICTIVADNDCMVLSVHCTWDTLKQYTCSNIICTFRDSFKSLWCI